MENLKNLTTEELFLINGGGSGSENGAKVAGFLAGYGLANALLPGIGGAIYAYRYFTS
ncbi:hypothetical protein [Elizabethkingia anophelis]|uniref:hypothetical protein n=1 Tax=Elizabethkingia anophelis TaxID=1117645 RepID=UPI00293712B8